MSTRRRRFLTALVASTLLAGTTATSTGTTAASTGQPGGAEAVDGTTARFVGVIPCRLFDSRPSGAPRPAGDTAVVDARGRCAIPPAAVAAAVTITVTEPVAAGYVTAWGDGDQPGSSSANFVAGDTTANSSIVPLGDDGRIRVVTDVDAHVIVDVAGAFVTVESSRAGRFTATEPTRVADTRAAGEAMSPGATVTVPLPAGVPDDAVALAATLTIVEALHDGHVTAFPAGAPLPEASVANVAAGDTHAASAILPVSPDGLSVYSTAGGHLLVDVTGWFTGPSAPRRDDGLFVPVSPVRLHDSRDGRRPLDAGGTREIAVPPDGAAWAVNVTATDVRADGFATVLPARTPRPTTSVLNPTVGAATSNSAVVPVTEHGLAVYTSQPLDIVVDGFGWFTGTPLTATTGPAPDLVAPRRVLVMGDSAAAGMRWRAGATQPLRGAEFTLDLQSCRRLVSPSCRGREGFRPVSALPAIEARAYGEFDTLVMATGYNDIDHDFGTAFDQIVAAARTRGMRSIVWLTYREDVGYQLPSGAATSYAAMNDVLHARAGSADLPDVVALDWWAYTADASHWFASDGVHLSTAGAYGMADVIARSLAALDGRACTAPWAPDEPVEAPCPTPDHLPAERDGVPDVLAIYAPDG